MPAMSILFIVLIPSILKTLNLMMDLLIQFKRKISNKGNQ